MVESRRLPFRPGDVCWKVMREPVVGLGAAPTLLLQVTHPLVAAGVQQYSDFEADPFGRLWRTADIMLKLGFGAPEVSDRQARILRRMHERVRGVSDDGVPYDALDPDLLTWVWATLLNNGLVVYELTFGPLSPADRERFYGEQKLIAYACGVPEGHCPATFADFRAYFDRMVAQELRPTAVARTVLDASGHLPMPWPLGPISNQAGLIAAGALLPERLRVELGIPWSPARARTFDALVAANRVVARLTPTSLRTWPTDYMVGRRRPLRLFQVSPQVAARRRRAA